MHFTSGNSAMIHDEMVEISFLLCAIVITIALVAYNCNIEPEQGSMDSTIWLIPNYQL